MNINNIIPYPYRSHDDINVDTPRPPADALTDDENKALIEKVLWEHSWRVFVQQTTIPPETEEW